MLLYYITDWTQFPGTESQRRKKLLEQISEVARSDVDFIQLREKDLSARELEALAFKAVEAVRAGSNRTRILINSRTDVALAVGADGVHLRSNDISPAEVRNIWRMAGARREPIIAASCHREAEVSGAAESGADFVVLGPTFEKCNVAFPGVEKLRLASRFEIPVLALGGVNIMNAAPCIEAGAAGIAGIRLFQHGDVKETVARLRSLSP